MNRWRILDNTLLIVLGVQDTVERILKKKLGGGFTVNTGRAIANMAPQSQVRIIGALGYPTIDPIYEQLPSNVILSFCWELRVNIGYGI